MTGQSPQSNAGRDRQVMGAGSASGQSEHAAHNRPGNGAARDREHGGVTTGQPAQPPRQSNSHRDPYTMAAQLCDDDGIVRGGGMHNGTDYPCTGHAHYAGEHIYCTGPAHEHPTADLPVDLMLVLRDQSIVLERDGAVWALIGREAAQDA